MIADWELLIPYEVLVAAVREALPGYAHGWVDFTEKTMLGCTIFHLRQEQLGDKLGHVKVRKLGEGRTELSTSGPQRLPSRSLTQQEKDSLKGAPQQRILDVLRKIDNEADELNHRKKEHFNAVVRVLFNRLNEDVLLRRAIEAAQPDTSEPSSGDGVGELPPEPHRGTAREWIDWMHDMARAGYNFTLKEIARKSGSHVYGTMKNAHEGCSDPDCPIRKRRRRT